MIDLQTGNFTFPELSISLTPLYFRNDFISIFPKDRIIKIRDMGNGYIWYDVREKVYDTDFKIPVWICFNPQDELEYIDLYPQAFDAKANRMWAAWTEDEMKRDKKYCNEWLIKYCRLKQDENQFTWGTITVYYDPRSASCGICMKYAKLA